MKFPPLEANDKGFGHRGDPLIPWSAVRRIIGFKLDLLTTDELRIRVESTGEVPVFEASEEQDGFETFVTHLEQRFCLLEDWRGKVLTPAFARNETVLFADAA